MTQKKKHASVHAQRGWKWRWWEERRVSKVRNNAERDIERERDRGREGGGSALNIYFFLFPFLSPRLAARHLWWFTVVLKHLCDIVSCRLPRRKIEEKRLVNFLKFSLTRSFHLTSDMWIIWENEEIAYYGCHIFFFSFINYFLVEFYGKFRSIDFRFYRAIGDRQRRTYLYLKYFAYRVSKVRFRTHAGEFHRRFVIGQLWLYKIVLCI